VTIAPITTTIRGLSTEVYVDAANGLSEPSVVSCDNITTIPTDALGKQIGVLFDRQERTLSDAIQAAFDLD
jgi:mRNA interferase MazF